VAADAGLLVVDATYPSDLTVVKRIPTCGRAVGVEIFADEAIFATPFGLGRSSIEGTGLASPDEFNLILPSYTGQWEITAIDDTAACWLVSALATAACSWLQCPRDRARPMTLHGGFVYISAFENVLTIDMLDGDMEIVDQFDMQARTDAMRALGGYLYLSLDDETTQTLDIHDPYQPAFIGTHDVQDWVRGLHVSENGVIRVVEGGVEMAARQ
jgi:hypothetical protein